MFNVQGHAESVQLANVWSSGEEELLDDAKHNR